MPVVWRIVTDTPEYSSDDLSGKGAESTGGRWNKTGTPLLYASASIALACMESVVHLGAAFPLPLNRYLVKIEMSAGAWKKRVIFDPLSNIGWDAIPTGLISVDWGTSWAHSLASLIVEVPSVIVPEESNFLFNPRHPDASALRVAKLRKWTYDARM